MTGGTIWNVSLLLDGMMVWFVRHEQVEFPSADDAARSPALSVI